MCYCILRNLKLYHVFDRRYVQATCPHCINPGMYVILKSRKTDVNNAQMGEINAQMGEIPRINLQSVLIKVCEIPVRNAANDSARCI